TMRVRSGKDIPTMMRKASPVPSALAFQTCNHGFRITHPTENATLCFDHLEGIFLAFREIGADTIFRDNAFIATVICFAHGGGYANFGCYTTNYQRLDTVVLQNQM